MSYSEKETYCEACGSTVTIEIENGHELFACDDKDNCNHKIWTDGDKYNG